MKGFHHPDDSQQAFLTGLAHLYNLVPYQRRAQHAGQCGVEGGRVPTHDWMLNLQSLTSGGFRCVVIPSYHEIGWNVGFSRSCYDSDLRLRLRGKRGRIFGPYGHPRAAMTAASLGR